jgi:hypothetical protein
MYYDMSQLIIHHLLSIRELIDAGIDDYRKNVSVE